MREKPILFSGEMVQAILEGRKTQTRRVMKPQPQIDQHSYVWYYGDDVFLSDTEMKSHLFHEVYGNHGSPYGSVYSDGTHDTLWVREKFQAQNQMAKWWHEIPRDEREFHNWAWTNPIMPALQEIPPRWLPSIHMPRAACRLFLNVIDVRVERLQEISAPEALEEGIWKNDNTFGNMYHAGERYYATPTGAFAALWNSINASRGYSWESNPWVWVVEFTPANPHSTGLAATAPQTPKALRTQRR